MDRAALPAIDRLLRLVPDLPRAIALPEARRLVAEVRAGAAAPEDWERELRRRIGLKLRRHLQRVVNATGVVLHTNLGRAPMGAEVAEAVARAAAGYVNLEFDLDTGARGERMDGIGPLIMELCGAEAALAVNNNAAAVLLMLSAVAGQAGGARREVREIIVSRGELVEIGGSFRIPEVIAQGGARLVEVGTTNRTRLSDYQRATGPETAAWLTVHRSNFRIEGFTEAPDRRELAGAAHAAGVPLLEDLGAGALAAGLGEPTVQEVLAAGVDAACFSGDKLLGGPQAGIIAGKTALVEQMRRHPLYRALRLDRLVLAALEATLHTCRRGAEPPAVQMLRATPMQLRARADRWAVHLRAHGIACAVEPDVSAAGGGSLPGEGLPTFSLCLPDSGALLRALRGATPPIIGRMRDGTLRLDPRTVLQEEEEALLGALVRAVAALSPAAPTPSRTT